MSFRCEVCHRACPQGYRPNIITGTAPCEHPARPAVKRENGEVRYKADPGGAGWRITGQKLACNACVGKPEPEEFRKTKSMLP